MTKKERYLDVLKTFHEPVTIAQWAKAVAQKYPVLLNQINSKTNEPMTLKELTATLSFKVSRAEFRNVMVENSSPYRKVYYLSDLKQNRVAEKIAIKDVELIFVEAKKKQDIQKSSESDRYRLEEFQNIVEQLNKYFKLNFQLHYTLSLIPSNKLAKHHVNNLEILTKEHSELKKDGSKRFSLEEQKAYIKRAISIYLIIKKDIDINLTDEVLEMLLDRLEKIY